MLYDFSCQHEVFYSLGFCCFFNSDLLSAFPSDLPYVKTRGAVQYTHSHAHTHLTILNQTAFHSFCHYHPNTNHPSRLKCLWSCLVQISWSPYLFLLVFLLGFPHLYLTPLLLGRQLAVSSVLSTWGGCHVAVARLYVKTINNTSHSCIRLCACVYMPARMCLCMYASLCVFVCV